ncbi:MAG: hypothetical protein VX534_02040, partial [Pseudomonadota bacterium]|nr:hypothetical protein [Pseudomonadota bacterium]
KLRIVKVLDGLNILQEIDYEFQFQTEYNLTLNAENKTLTASINGEKVMQVEDIKSRLLNVGIGFVVESGTESTNEIIIS